MPPQGRLGDKASIAADAHGCLACPHPGTGPAVAGSSNVLVNRRPALRVDDPGIHAACCGKNTWSAAQGSDSVFINGKPAHRLGDQTHHCGGLGQLVEGSANVIIGGGATSVGRAPPESTASASFTLRDARGEALADVRYLLTTPDGQQRQGRTDASGGARVDGLKPGKCRLRFPDLEG